MVEPGSTTSVRARLRRLAWSGLPALELNEGWLTIASTSPVATSRITIEPDTAWFSSRAVLSSR